jgi:hypothetical protein
MVALTRDFHVFASGVTTGFTAILLAIAYIAQARYVRALLGFLIRHYDSILFSDLGSDPGAEQVSWNWSFRCPRYLYQLHSDRQNPRRRKHRFAWFCARQQNTTKS